MKSGSRPARHVLMVRPAGFGSNVETRATNAFQRGIGPADPDPRAAARVEFDGVVGRLGAAGVRAMVMEDTPVPAKPDAVFPNNWISFHEDGTVILYPMEAPSRRAERRPDVIRFVEGEAGFRVRRLVDLSPLEQTGQFLEGTGSLVIDHAAGIAYAALSSRTHSRSVARFARETGLDTMVFTTRDETGIPLYHTNVMLSIGEHFVVICAEVIPDRGERRSVLERLAATGREIIRIESSQMKSFAANILELGTTGTGTVVAMSESAYRAFRPGDREALAAHATIVATPVPVIERVGGGSVRCMLAEVFAPGDP